MLLSSRKGKEKKEKKGDGEMEGDGEQGLEYDVSRVYGLLREFGSTYHSSPFLKTHKRQRTFSLSFLSLLIQPRSIQRISSPRL